MKKLFVYGAFLLALSACKSESTKKTDDKTTPSTSTGTDKTTPSTTTPSTKEGSTTGSWSDADREAFLKSCSEEAAKSIGEDKALDYCSCMGEKLEKMYPNANDANNMTKADMQKVAEDCPR